MNKVTNTLKVEDAKNVTEEEVREAIDTFVDGKDTYGVKHKVYYDPDKGEFFERFAEAGEEIENETDKCIRIYYSSAYSGNRYSNEVIAYKLLTEREAANFNEFIDQRFNHLISDGEIDQQTRSRLEKCSREDFIQWMLVNKLSWLAENPYIESRKEGFLHEEFVIALAALRRRDLIKEKSNAA